jgi:hypothetical protein
VICSGTSRGVDWRDNRCRNSAAWVYFTFIWLVSKNTEDVGIIRLTGQTLWWFGGIVAVVIFVVSVVGLSRHRTS